MDQLRLLTDAAPIGIFQTDRRNRNVYTNPRWSEITGSTDYVNRLGIEYTGLERQVNYDWAWALLVHPDDATSAQRGWEEAIRETTPFNLECRIRRADRRFRWDAIEVFPVRGDDGRIARWVGTAVDVEDRRILAASSSNADRETAEAPITPSPRPADRRSPNLRTGSAPSATPVERTRMVTA